MKEIEETNLKLESEEQLKNCEDMHIWVQPIKEYIKKLEAKEALEQSKIIKTPLEALEHLVDRCAYAFEQHEDVKVVRQSLTELEELKATVKELLDIPFTVSTVNGTSLLIKTMNKLQKLVGAKDE